MVKKSIFIDNYNIYYVDNEAFDKKVLLFAHGWGADKYNLRAIYDKLESSYRIIAIDLPGFGESSVPEQCIGSPEYASIVSKFLHELGVREVSYVGHSFGGKVGIVLAASNVMLVKNLFLIDSSGLRAKHGFVWYTRVYSYKLMKFILSKVLRSPSSVDKLKLRFGSSDYRDAGCMREILVRTVNEDFSDMLPKISCPTFLYWGEKDRDTPIWMANKMNKLIKDSGLFVVKGSGHFSFLDDARIVDIIASLVK